MGAQKYETEITSRAHAALAAEGEQWQVQRVVSRSLRSPLPGDRRIPTGRLFKATRLERRILGGLIYKRRSLVHRMDLLLPPPPGPDVVTLHDVVSWKFSDESAPVKAAAHELRAADAVICVSQFTADEATELLGLKDPVVIPNGVDEDYFDAQPLDVETLNALGLRKPFVLYAGGSAARKNLPSLADAWRRIAGVRPEWSLALAGPTTPTRSKLFFGLPQLVHLGRLADELMPGLIASADAVVVPSLYEGFGLPALEAMAAGTPLLCSNRSSLPEVVGETGTLVSPTPEALAAGLEHVTSGSDEIVRLTFLARVRAAQFTWDRSARAHAQVWRSVR
ncbi:glycosyltransferase family 4 protein [Ornithinimicrobium avium]|nr:glycosyltransferase family 1 protein [Ornithinimicrobium avium]